MQIDWLTVVAQIVNFLILVALLKRFLYRPVLDAMDRREQRIGQQLREAEAREAEADARARRFQEQTDDLQKREQEILEQARDAADREGRDRLQAARTEVEHQRERWRAQLEQEWEDLQRTLGARLGGAVTAAMTRALTDLADADLERAIARAFCRRLDDLGDEDRQAIADGDGPIEIATAFAPDDDTRGLLAGAVRRHFGREARFVRADDLIVGIELRVRGWKMSWTLAAYVRDIEVDLADALAAGHHTVR